MSARSLPLRSNNTPSRTKISPLSLTRRGTSPWLSAPSIPRTAIRQHSRNGPVVGPGRRTTPETRFARNGGVPWCSRLVPIGNLMRAFVRKSLAGLAVLPSAIQMDQSRSLGLGMQGRGNRLWLTEGTTGNRFGSSARIPPVQNSYLMWPGRSSRKDPRSGDCDRIRWGRALSGRPGNRPLCRDPGNQAIQILAADSLCRAGTEKARACRCADSRFASGGWIPGVGNRRRSR